MKKISAHSKTSLFLMERSLFCFFWHFPALPVSVSLLLQKNHIQAQEWRHIQTLTTSVGEILEDSDGTAKSFVSLFPDGQIQDNLIEWYYDSSWQLCSDSQASYKMELTLHETANPRQEPLLSITPQMIYRFTRLIWFFLLLKIQTRRPAHERPQQLFYCHGNSLSVSDLFRALSCSAFFADTRKFPFRIKHRP